MKAAVARVVAALHAAGIEAPVTEFSESTHTAEEAAAAVGATLGQIVKSLIFVAGDRPVLALVSGANRVDVARLATAAGGPIRRADADTVRTATGYAIGGVPPLGHPSVLPTFLDADLRRYERVWAAAGTPNAVFPITPAELERVTGAQVVDLAARPAAS
ncbi:MAG TPA: YbaK/EbsC family protein [Longimicrobiales bacterium]